MSKSKLPNKKTTKGKTKDGKISMWEFMRRVRKLQPKMHPHLDSVKMVREVRGE